MKDRSDPWLTSTAVIRQEWLIETIVIIKGLKQHQSAERVCGADRQAHKKSHGPVLQEKVIIAWMDQAVNDAKTLKVCNKNQTSCTESNHHTRQLTLSETDDLFKVLIKGIRELAESGGSNMVTFEKHVQQSFSRAADVVNSSQLIRIAWHKAVQKGLLVQEGQYFREALCREVKQHRQKRHSSFASSTLVLPEDSDDGDYGHPLKDYEEDLHYDTHSSLTTLFCSECLGTSENNSQGEHKALISCPECGSSVHPFCLERAGLSVPKADEHDEWLFSECKSCNICGERAEFNQLLICSTSEQRFHVHCLDPPQEKRPKNRVYSYCQARRKSSKENTKSNNTLSRRCRMRAKHVESSEDEDEDNDYDDDAEGPEVKDVVEKIPPPLVVMVRYVELFKKVQQTTAETLKVSSIGANEPSPRSVATTRCQTSMQFRRHENQIWFSSQFPQECTRLSKLFLCEFYLINMKSQAILHRHKSKCPIRKAEVEGQPSPERGEATKTETLTVAQQQIEHIHQLPPPAPSVREVPTAGQLQASQPDEFAVYVVISAAEQITPSSFAKSSSPILLCHQAFTSMAHILALSSGRRCNGSCAVIGSLSLGVYTPESSTRSVRWVHGMTDGEDTSITFVGCVEESSFSLPSQETSVSISNQQQAHRQQQQQHPYGYRIATSTRSSSSAARRYYTLIAAAQPSHTATSIPSVTPIPPATTSGCYHRPLVEPQARSAYHYLPHLPSPSHPVTSAVARPL